MIPGAANRAAAGLAHLAPKALILPLLASQHPALKESWKDSAPEGPPPQG